MNVLIIEDEFRAVNQLRKLLTQIDVECTILEVLDSVEASVFWLKNNKMPDLVFMDIQLADGLSFEIFQKVKVETPIIFTTAFDQYAIQAFKVNSIDYLLKPIRLEDLQVALSKFKETVRPKGLSPETLSQLVKQMLPEPVQNFRESILIKQGDTLLLLKVEDLLFCYSENSVTFGVTKSKRFIIDETLDQLFNSFSPKQFFKINRGQIVAKHAVLQIKPYFNHRLKLKIEGGDNYDFTVSRQKTGDFKNWLNQ
ncbi:LytTR family DNA-binding domain-containing protein [Aquimarina sp. ERC-38]|uniref:LytR/AlgR family response regulator transcription factor n=1 Tax=Aquimarina sp. ERC-38 TaxID=2949996 RepID=UPI0022484A3F|nr:LytTR family DNA-binding domain-containing protein [Aquimarina sp. ERC-38]UZO80503.1 LytTR family DNA-binding domain-containing protein [Aquimarina sp. ERC-38]